MSVDKKSQHLDPAYQTALTVGAMLNIAMWFIEGSAGLWIGSAALLADAGDFLEDAAVLGLALVAVRWSVRGRAVAGLRAGHRDGRSRGGSNLSDYPSYSQRRRTTSIGDGRRGSACSGREWVLRVLLTLTVQIPPSWYPATGGQDFPVVHRERAIWSYDVSCAQGVWSRRAWSQEGSLERKLLRGDLS
jgi:hypothetical protein